MNFKPVEVDAIVLSAVRYRTPMSPSRLEDALSGEYGVSGADVRVSLFRLIRAGFAAVDKNTRVIPRAAVEV